MFWLSFCLSAAAQVPADEPIDDELGVERSPPPPPAFTFDSVLITTFQALDRDDQPKADRLHQSLVERFSAEHAVVPMAEVPGFEVHEYGAELYMQSCPPGQYGGCALVLGQRALADWAVGATVGREVDEYDPTTSHLVLNLFLVDVSEARESGRFSVPLIGQEDSALQGIVGVFDDMVAGVYDLEDLRDDDPERAAIEAARRQLMGAYLEELEAELGEVVEGATPEVVEPELVTRAEVEQAAEEEATPAWERAGLSPSAYVRFLNSGEELDDWKRTHQGRQGAILFRVAVGTGRGPWSQNYAARLLRDEDDLNPIHSVQVLEVENGGTITGDLEVGFGVLPFLDISVVGGLHTGSAVVLREEVVEGDPLIEGQPASTPLTTYHLGVLTTVAPWAHATLRPTGTAGVVWWQGSGISIGEPYPRLNAPQQLVMQLLPGLELDSSSRTVSLFGRLGAEGTDPGRPQPGERGWKWATRRSRRRRGEPTWLDPQVGAPGARRAVPHEFVKPIAHRGPMAANRIPTPGHGTPHARHGGGCTRTSLPGPLCDGRRHLRG